MAEVNCEVCGDKKILTITVINEVLQKIIGKPKYKGDLLWT